jgi:hypothetical protein
LCIQAILICGILIVCERTLTGFIPRFSSSVKLRLSTRSNIFWIIGSPIIILVVLLVVVVLAQVLVLIACLVVVHYLVAVALVELVVATVVFQAS